MNETKIYRYHFFFFSSFFFYLENGCFDSFSFEQVVIDIERQEISGQHRQFDQPVPGEC